MHILVVTHSFPSNAEPVKGSFIRKQVRFLRPHVRSLTVLAPVSWAQGLRASAGVFGPGKIPLDSFDPELGCRVLRPRYFKVPGTAWPIVPLVAFWRLIDRVVAHEGRNNPVDVLHAHYAIYPGWASVHVGRKWKIPVGVTYHGVDVNETIAHHREGWRAACEAARMADVNLPVSRALRDVLRANVPDAARCEVRFLGVDTSIFRPGTLPPERPTVLYVGLLARAKGVLDLLRAWPEIRKRVPNARLVLAGPDGSGGEAAALVRRLGIAESVELRGVLGVEAVAAQMQRSTLLCLPSYSEGTPVSVMEGLSSGLPIVATRVGGIPDIVKNGESGLLVPAGDQEALVEALCAVLKSPERAVALGEAARRFAVAALDGDSCARATVDVYRDLLERRKSDRAERNKR